MTTVDQTSVPTATGEVALEPRRKPTSLLQRQRRWGWLFLSPWIFGFVVFTAAPILASLLFTFTDFNLNTSEIHWVGLANWQRLFTDPQALTALGVTIRFAVLAVPIGIIIPLAMATMLNAKYLMAKRLWRTLFYMPYIVPIVSVVFIWQSVLNGQTGWVNRGLELLGITNAPNWLQDERWILPAFILIGLWGVGNAMLTILATMQGVPTELYEAASVDGANAWVKWRKITVPMISPVIFYNLVLSVIGLMQYFTIPYIVTHGTGQPGQSAYFFNMLLYKTAFTYADMGYGAAQAWLIFIVGLVLTIVLFGTARRWVYYASGE